MKIARRSWPAALLLLLLLVSVAAIADEPATLRATWDKNTLTIRGPKLPGGAMNVNYLEAFCRPGSTNRDWRGTVIPHKTQLVSAADDGTSLVLRSTLDDGVTVEHVITAHADHIDFALTAHNPTDHASLAHWAQPCVRVADFAGCGDKDTKDASAYIHKCFVFQGGRLQRMPTEDWATKARYTPGQVWCPIGVPHEDLNPRPLNPHAPDNGLIGCFNADETMIFAMAWDHYQELFQGVARCAHSDFRIGGLAPGETKKIHGKMYFLPNDIPALLKRYNADFPDAK
ncbi:MAG: hypothetical protein GC162_09710 [Planctomycetes bacterium]|nr:hypothetical protein [Planctomycetota bacterium]